MPVYSFQGRREQTGAVVRGVREAASHVALGQELRTEGILLTRYEERRQASGAKGFFSLSWGRVPLLERVLFARYFALMLRAGFDVKKALGVLQEQLGNRTLRGVIEALRQDVEKGKTLTESMGHFPKVFPPIFISFVQVGEVTGRLEESLTILAQQMQKDYDLRRTVRGAMLYPAVIVAALIAVGFAMLIFVIPRLAEVFSGFNVELPAPTRIVLALGQFFDAYWYVVLIAMFLAAGGAWLLLRIKTVKAFLLHAVLFMPIFSSIMQKVNLARFNRNLSSLLTSGVSFVEALVIMGTNTSHPSYARVLMEAVPFVKSGKPLSEYLGGFPRLFPPLVVSVVKIGEETGELSKVLEETAGFFEAEVDQTMKNFTSILEPVLMVIIGLAVGGLAVSVISPIYNLVNVL
jgi:type IV pilus assembly protein PilC